jgi:uncharacterized C2H2 Zn-finger protein
MEPWSGDALPDEAPIGSIEDPKKRRPKASKRSSEAISQTSTPDPSQNDPPSKKVKSTPTAQEASDVEMEAAETREPTPEKTRKKRAAKPTSPSPDMENDVQPPPPKKRKPKKKSRGGGRQKDSSVPLPLDLTDKKLREARIFVERDEDGRYTCIHCDKFSRSTKTKYIDHLFSSHMDKDLKKRFQCPECDTWFVRYDSYHAHYKKFHQQSASSSQEEDASEGEDVDPLEDASASE